MGFGKGDSSKIVGISYVFWIILQAHIIYRCSISLGSIPRYRYLFYPKAVARNDNKREILVITTTQYELMIGGNRNMVGRDNATSQAKITKDN